VLPIRDDNPTRHRAVVTVALIVANLAIYFGVQATKSAVGEQKFVYRWAAVPCEVDTGKPIVAVPVTAAVAPDACVLSARGFFEAQPIFPAKNVWLAVLFAMFLHGSILHVLGNMWFLWIFGNNVEDQLGHWSYLVLYLLGGIVASGVHIVGNLHSTVPFLGASGAIAFVMGAYIVWFPRARVLTLVVYFPIRLPALIVLGSWFVLQFFTQSDSGIATLAHIGGFAFGALVAFALARLGGFPRDGYLATS
jgi:membrane associated rhomboid family serine protease